MLTSRGTYLEIRKAQRLVSSYWDLTETEGIRYDSEGNNHLDYISAAPSFSVSGSFNAGETMTFTNTSNISADWLWGFGDENISTEENSTNIYDSAGFYIISLTMDGESSIHQTIEII